MMKMSYYRPMLTTADLVASPVYIIFIMIFAYFIRGVLVKKNNPIYQYFIPGLFLKLIGSALVGMLYFFYYHGGDTTEYYNNAIVLYEAFNDSPFYFFKLLVAGPNFDDPAIINYKWWMYFHHDESAWFYAKLCSVATLFAFNIYTPTALLMALVSYTGVWALYVTLCKIYPEMYKKFALAVLFIPSVFFWGSGMLKDSITFCCVGWMTYCTYHIFFERKGIILNAIGLLLSSYVCLKLKPYIVFSMMPALIFWVFLYYRSKFRTAFSRVVFGPLAFIGGGFFGYLIIHRLGAQYSSYSLEGAVKTAEGFQEWHGWLAENAGASGYSLGVIDGSFKSILFKIPAAANVTLFRPYIWEVHNPVMMLSAAESLLMMLFAISIFIRTGVINTFRALGRNPTAFFCIFFSVFFAFAVGFTAYNYGALARYKIPCIPFFVAGLYILNMQTQLDKQRRKAKTHVPRPNLSLETA